MSMLPLFLNLTGKRVLLVGGGSVARAKLEALRPTGCHLRVVTLAVTEAFQAALTGFEVELHLRAFRPEDLEGAQLVISATNDPEAHRIIAAHARHAGVWVNAVDEPAACDVMFPSVLRRGPFAVAVSTEGAFAGLSRVVREALEGLIPDATVPEFEALVALRRELRERHPDPVRRGEMLRALLAEVQADLDPIRRAS